METFSFILAENILIDHVNETALQGNIPAKKEWETLAVYILF